MCVEILNAEAASRQILVNTSADFYIFPYVNTTRHNRILCVYN